MHTLEEVYNYFPVGFFDRGLKILHHNSPTSLLMDSDFFSGKTIKLSPNMVIIQVNDELHSGLSKINKLPFENKEQIIELIEDPYQKWISKPRALYNYIKENYETLPDYILYTDSTDVVIIEDILNPQEILDFYKCQVLFNVEPNFTQTGFLYPSADFYQILFEKHSLEYRELNFKKYGVHHDRALNAGVFLGKKNFLLELLREACEYMSADYKLGFPYGCMDDQYMFRYLQNKYYDDISCDVYNKFLLFAYPKCIETEDENDWEHYTYFQRHNIHLYSGVTK